MPGFDVSPGAAPGGVVGFATQATDRTTTGTTFAAGVDVLSTPISFRADGVSSYMVQLLGPGQTNSTATANLAALNLDGAADRFMMHCNVGSGNPTAPLSGMGVITPTAGVHTVNVRFYVGTGTGTLYAGVALTNSMISVIVTKLASVA